MPPVIGYTIVIAVLAVIVFFCGRNVIRGIRAELRGEGSCAGCSKAGTCGFSSASGGSGCNPDDPSCMACMAKMEELKKLAREKEAKQE